MRGGERVLEILCHLYPRAELFTLVHLSGSVSDTIEARPVHRSFVQRLPNVRRFYRHYLPLFPAAVEQFNLDDFDLVISTSHCAIKSVIAPGRARHLCYCLTPMRYAWDQFDAYFGPDRVGRWPSRLLKPILKRLARWDRETARRADRYVAISQYVAQRIARYYNRRASVVHPPVDTRFYSPAACTGDRFLLIVSALVPYKRIDVAVRASQKAGVPLKIVGSGPERARLQEMAGPAVEFVGNPPDAEVRDLYRRSAALVLPGEEDFGIAPLEAQACGRPVVALARGGALETVIDGQTGILVDDPSDEALADAMRRVMTNGFDPAAIRANAERFGRERFEIEIAACIEETLAAPPGTRW
ncbi:MAG: glycosyltransferase [Acidobacteria bacterium]|nr:glycosyltransferase [Acidobacteriota bacterium]